MSLMTGDRGSKDYGLYFTKGNEKLWFNHETIEEVKKVLAV